MKKLHADRVMFSVWILGIFQPNFLPICQEKTCAFPSCDNVQLGHQLLSNQDHDQINDNQGFLL